MAHEKVATKAKEGTAVRLESEARITRSLTFTSTSDATDTMRHTIIQ